jgi:hypothetical protein
MAALFAETAPNNGFDGWVNPRWLLLPRRESREVYLWGGNGLRLAFRQPDSTLAECRRTGDRIRIEALMTGRTTLEATDAKGIVQARLDVEVVDPLEVTTAFHFVGDSESQ